MPESTQQPHEPMRAFWEQKVCTLLKEVNDIEMWVLHREPTTAYLRNLGKAEWKRRKRLERLDDVTDV